MPQMNQQPMTQQPTQAANPQSADVARKLVLAAMKTVFDPGVSKQLLAMMQGGADPAQSVAQAATLVVSKMGESAKGGTPEMATAIMPVVCAFLFQLAEAAGLFKADPQALQQAIQLAQKQIMGQGQRRMGASQGPGEQMPEQQAPAQPAGPGLVNQPPQVPQQGA